MYAELIDYFGKGIKSDDIEKVDFGKLNAKAVLLGYVIHPDCCNAAVEEWLDSLTRDYNATFYKEWNDIMTKDRFELFIDQILHYATTYGTGFSFGNGYVPNDGATVPTFTNLKVIEPITESELFDKCLGILESGIALKEDTMQNLVKFVDYWTKFIGYELSDTIALLDSIKNKEAQAVLSRKFGLLPHDEFGMLRCVVYDYIGSTLLIKDQETLNALKRQAKEYGADAPLLTLHLGEFQLRKLSQIFHRFKPIFLAMKTKHTARIINKLRRYAKTYHTPFRTGFWENIVSVKRPLSEVYKRIPELDNFRKVRLLTLIREKIMFETKSGVFPIRNGKLFVRKNYTPEYDLNYLRELFLAIKKSLVDSLRAKACTVRLPKELNLVLPSSEKTFIGNIPFGSSFRMTENNVVGIYWRNEWGTRDYDLSALDLNGRLLSWRGNYYSEDMSMVFSGDMTSADPEATELFFIKDTAPDCMFKVNKFSGLDKSKFRFFFANELLDPEDMENHMVDPNNVKVDVMVDFDGQGEKAVGAIFDNTFYFMDFRTGKDRVSRQGDYVEIMVDSMKRKAKSFICLGDILKEAGFEILEDGSERTPDIDFSNPTKDMFTKLLSSEN